MKNSPIALMKTIASYLIIMACFAILGCAGVGSTIPTERRIPLIEAKNHQGNFSYGPLSLEYSYALAGSNMILGGSNMILAGKASYQGGFDSLDIRILFLDAAGTVLQQKPIHSSGYRTGSRKGSDRVFQKTFAVPAGSVAITFNYSAQDRSSHK